MTKVRGVNIEAESRQYRREVAIRKQKEAFQFAHKRASDLAAMLEFLKDGGILPGVKTPGERRKEIRRVEVRLGIIKRSKDYKGA